jgi:hypothetical protein
MPGAPDTTTSSRPPPADPLEGRGEPRQLSLSTVQRLREDQATGDVSLAERERGDPAAGAQLLQAAAQVGLQADGGLVAILGVLGQQSQDDLADDLGHVGAQLGRRRRRARDVGVDQAHRRAALERQAAGEALEQGGAEAVEVAAGVDAAVDPAGLLRRDVGERAAEAGDGAGAGAVAGDPLGDAEVGEAHVGEAGWLRGFALWIVGLAFAYDDVAGPNILMQHVARVHLTQRLGELDPQLQELSEGQRGLGDDHVQRLASDVLEHQHGAVVGPLAAQAPHRALPDQA